MSGLNDKLKKDQNGECKIGCKNVVIEGGLNSLISLRVGIPVWIRYFLL